MPAPGLATAPPRPSLLRCQRPCRTTTRTRSDTDKMMLIMMIMMVMPVIRRDRDSEHCRVGHRDRRNRPGMPLAATA